jgi:carbohydrate diacid regulator
MASRLFQSIILQMKDSVDRIIGIIDSTGAVVACTDLPRIGEVREDAAAELGYAGEMIRFGGYTYRSTSDSTTRFEYAIFVQGEDELARSTCSLVTVAINNIKTLYDEKHDKATFIKNIILDNILPGDIYIKSRELHFGNDVPRAVFLIRQVDRNDIAAIDIVQGMFPDKQKDFVIHISESDIVLVKKVKQNCEIADMVKIAANIEQILNTELMTKTIIGIGSVALQLKDIAKSFKEAQVAIEVGGVFDTEKSIISYENLGIGRLIYQLPTTLCEMFLTEVFKKGSIDALDQETLFTIQKFFENNLNVSETSRKLFVHRNTLVYRLEKIKKLTGLDMREFDHAIVFKVALMVRKYLASREENKY